MTKYEQIIRDEVLDFFANCTTRFSNKGKEIINLYDDDWWKTESEEEETFLSSVVQDLMDAEGIWENDYVFEYKNRKGEYIEYDNTKINAPDEETAWLIFLNISGEYGCPDECDYFCYSC